MDWYHRLYEGREAFDDLEEEQAYRERQKALTRPEAEALCRLLGLPNGSGVLDAFCGNGRHATALAARGFEAVGLDTSFSRIAFAQRWARDEGLSAAFVVGDARAIPLRGPFDAVLILGGSFSHCLDWGENIALLRGLRDLLVPGGLLLIDNPNPLRFWRVQNPTASAAERAALPYYDLPLGTKHAAGFVRYYCPQGMSRLFEDAGLKITRIHGDRAGESYSPDSPRMVTMGVVR